jgi:GntR family transcriptional regulator/MocR family aminotransferase
MDLHVGLADGRGDLAARIYRQLLDAILDGRLRPGERLPPTRELARSLEVSRNTVAAAYERLTADGFLAGRVGAGTFVADSSVGSARTRRRAPGGADVAPRRLWRTIPASGGSAQPPAAPPRFDFQVGVPDARLFPLEAWRRLVGRELRPATVQAGGYGDPAGSAALRAAIARHIGVSRSVQAGADDVLVTQGTQQALDLIGRVLVDPGTCVAVEEPGYLPARLVFRALGARVVGVPVDAEGIEVSALPAGARLVYTTPSHQYPLGTPMSLPRRRALLAWAERHRAVVIEDDYDSEFRFSDRPLEPLQSLDRGGRVIYVGSFSKTMSPMLRVGFLVAPASLQQTLRTAKQLTDWHGDLTTQGALARFIDEGLFARHVRRATREYARRHERIVGILRRDLGDVLDLVPASAGLHLCARLSSGAGGVDVGAVVRRASAAGVFVRGLDTFCGERPVQHGLVIGYGAIALDLVDEGLRRLATAFTRL